MELVGCAATLGVRTIFIDVKPVLDFKCLLFQLNIDLQNVIKDLHAQHPDKVFAVKGMQR